MSCLLISCKISPENGTIILYEPPISKPSVDLVIFPQMEWNRHTWNHNLSLLSRSCWRQNNEWSFSHPSAGNLGLRDFVASKKSCTIVCVCSYQKSPPTVHTNRNWKSCASEESHLPTFIAHIFLILQYLGRCLSACQLRMDHSGKWQLALLWQCWGSCLAGTLATGKKVNNFGTYLLLSPTNWDRTYYLPN